VAAPFAIRSFGSNRDGMPARNFARRIKDVSSTVLAAAIRGLRQCKLGYDLIFLSCVGLTLRTNPM
jgi:hypothetical protein